MYAARIRLDALDPLWFRGLGPAGNAWNPSVIHATALNHALVTALGFQQPHTVFNALWTPHSLPYPQLGLWLSPTELVPGSARPVQIFRGGRSGETLQVHLQADKGNAAKEKEERGSSVYMTHITADGGFELVRGSVGRSGKPYSTTGYYGQWTGILMAEDSEALALLPEKGRKEASILLRLGPNRVMAALNIEEFTQVVEAEHVGFASHLSDPMLLPDDLEGEAVFAKPHPLTRVPANGLLKDCLVRTFAIRNRAAGN